MATFGKLNFAVAFNPQTAFPLDARSYFDSYAAAELAAQSAVEVGSSDGTYYFGQTLTVVEENKAKFYIIQPDKTLSAVGGDEGPVIVGINDGQFEYVDNKLTLKDSATATNGQVLSMDGNGNLAWVTPVDAYSKTEADTKITEAVMAADHLKRKIVDSVADINKDAADALQYIYMVPNGLTTDDDRYDEYLVVEVTDEEGSTSRFVEKVGTWAVELADYAKTADVEANYVKKNGTNRLITEAEGEKIAESEKNVINGADTAEFTIDEDRILSIKSIGQSKVSGLVGALSGKVDKQEGYTLLSPTDQQKLAKLTINGDQVEVSGTVNASNVAELDQWIEDHRDTVNGLLSKSNKAKLDLYDEIGQGLVVNLIDNKKQLSVSTIAISQVANLEDELNGKAAATDLATLKTSFEAVKEDVGVASTESSPATGLHLAVENIEDELNDFVKLADYTAKMSSIDSNINDLYDILIWKEITTTE